jgi:hypothetical protein
MYSKIGTCGLSCSLCPASHTKAVSWCGGCRSEARTAVGCRYITCAVKHKGIDFCWECEESKTCEKWEKLRESSKEHDSFKCYQTLEDDLDFIKEYGIEKFDEQQMIREQLLKEMLSEFNEGRSKSYYCIAATVMKIGELQNALIQARNSSNSLDIKAKSKVMHSILDIIARENGYYLKLRK